MGEFALGQPVSRFEDPRLLRGGGRYVDDMVLPRMAYGHVLRSPHAHARIRKIETREAKAAPGVLAVLTGADWEASGWGDLPVPTGMKRRDGSPSYKPRFPALVKDRVRWVGDYVAFVVAETAAAAADAAELIEVAYEPLRAVVSGEEALQPGAIQVWEDCPNNLCFVHLEGSKEATDAAFARADKIVKRRFVINRVTAATMEPRGALGDHNAAEDRYTIYTTLQRTHPYRAELANYVLKVPEAKIRVVAGDIGGSFGMKSAVYNEVALVLLGSKLTGRPVKWTSTRSEAFVSDAQARDNVTDAELALDKDGHFLGFRVKTIANLGAYLQMNSNVFVGNLGTLAGVYRTPAIYADVTAVFTHTNPVRPYRGNGRPEAAYVIERIVDCAAKELGIDPLELRRRNIIPPEAMPFKSGLTFTYDCGEFATTLSKAERAADFAGFPARRAAAKKRGKLRGIGISNYIEGAGGAPRERAEITVGANGRVELVLGTMNSGQGHETSFPQLICEWLGVPFKTIDYIAHDTDRVSAGGGSHSGRSMRIASLAIGEATDAIIEKGKKIAAQIFEASAVDIQFSKGVFQIEGTDRRMTIFEVAKAAATRNDLPDDLKGKLEGIGDHTVSVGAYPSGTHICEVEVDPDTGYVQLVGWYGADDVGLAVNPLILHGQTHGAAAQGIGQAMLEDVAYDRDSGQMLAGSFMDYAVPRADYLPSFDCELIEVPATSHKFGIRPGGEGGTTPALGACINAVCNALSELGVRHVEMPATPERVWRAIREARAK